MMKQPIFAVVRNGAFWSNHNTPEAAIERASHHVSHDVTHESFQGFDENGKSAVVRRPVRWTVEQFDNGGSVYRPHWISKVVFAEWIAGRRSNISNLPADGFGAHAVAGGQL